MRIDKSMQLFLREISDKRSPKTVQKYQDVLSLFHDYLASYAELSYEEHKDKGIVLTAETQELDDGQVSDFLEWCIIRKVIGPYWLMTSAPGIMKAYIKWLDSKGLLAEGSMDDIVEISRKTTKDLPRGEKAASLLYTLGNKNSGRFSGHDFKDENYMEGYGVVIGMIEDNLHLNYDGEKTGPIQITKEIAACLKKGDTLNLVVVRKGNLWYPIEAGNVYPG